MDGNPSESSEEGFEVEGFNVEVDAVEGDAVEGAAMEQAESFSLLKDLKL